MLLASFHVVFAITLASPSISSAGGPAATAAAPAVPDGDDSLTMDSAKQLAKAYAAMNAVIKAHPELAFPGTRKDSSNAGQAPAAPVESPVAAMTRHIAEAPALAAAVKGAGLTPDQYASSWSRFQRAWRYVLIEHTAINDGKTMGELNLMLKPLMTDIIFARAHGEDLRRLGLPAPSIPPLS